MSSLGNLGLQNSSQLQPTTKNKNPEKNPEIPNNYNFKCNGCESVFRKSWELKKHLDQMHSEKLTPLKSANVDTENIILYKRHIGKVKHTKLSVIRLKSIPNNRFLFLAVFWLKKLFKK